MGVLKICFISTYVAYCTVSLLESSPMFLPYVRTTCVNFFEWFLKTSNNFPAAIHSHALYDFILNRYQRWCEMEKWATLSSIFHLSWVDWDGTKYINRIWHGNTKGQRFVFWSYRNLGAFNLRLIFSKNYKKYRKVLMSTVPQLASNTRKILRKFAHVFTIDHEIKSKIYII